jgi:hypothetical protein
MERRIGFVVGLGTIESYADAFDDDIPLLAVQPRANYAPPLARLRGLVGTDAVWGFRAGKEPDWTSALVGWARR